MPESIWPSQTMRKQKHTLRRTMFVLLGLVFLWCLSLPYFILAKVDQGTICGTSENGLRPNGKALMETNKAQDVIKIFVQFLDDLLNVVESTDNAGSTNSKSYSEASPSSRLNRHKDNMKALEVKIEAEKAKGQMKDELIKELRSDKVQLQQQVNHLQELLKLHLKTEDKPAGQPDEEIPGDKSCPLPSLDGFPNCKEKLKWMMEMWKTDPCYGSYGVNGSMCSFLIYLSEVESWCPVLPGRAIPPPTVKTSKMRSSQAKVRTNFDDLYRTLANKTELTWIRQRIDSMEAIWVEAGRSLSAKYNLTARTARRILVFPGAITNEAGLKITENAFSGGPLGELVQWSDLISTLYILGHKVHLLVSKSDLKRFFGLKTGSCPSRYSKLEPDLIYTDIIGLKQMQRLLQESWTKYKCITRVLDSFGTEPDYNHANWAKNHNLKSPFGSLSLVPAQFYTMFPHTPDNTFLGFVVQHPLSPEERVRLQSTERRNQALVYGKSATFWKNKESYLDIIHKYLDVHGTVDNSAPIPGYVKNHGIVTGTEVQTLLRQSRVFVGLSFPYEGPAPLEALANGCAFLNPRLSPPRSSLNSDFFKGKPTTREVTSQHPYAEQIGQPYVWMVDMNNHTDVERAITDILKQNIEPYLPYEFTCEGMLQRVNVLIEKQNLCQEQRSWPPLSALQVVMAKAGSSCKQACQEGGLICEPAFFSYLNNAKNLATHQVNCQSSDFSDSSIVLPAYDGGSKRCLLQSDPLLFSCVRSDLSLDRICPCRDFMKEQMALCRDCV